MKRLAVFGALATVACSTQSDMARVETPATVDSSGKVQLALASVPPAVLAAATSAIPGFRATSAETETRDGRRYFDVSGTLPDGREVEFDIMEDAGRWRVVETQQDVDYAIVPQAVRTASGIDGVFRPMRVIESRQSDGITIYEFFGPKNNDPRGMKVEVRWDGREARRLDQEWAH